MSIPATILEPVTGKSFDVQSVRASFPALHRKVHGRDLVYLDSAATSQKPERVLQALSDYYRMHNANVHRGVHRLSEEATDLYESAREAVRSYISAQSTREIVFVRGTTEGINLVASSFGRSRVGPGDEIVITTLEHHSNIVPWQMLCQEKKAVLKVVPVDDSGQLDLGAYKALLSNKTRIVALGHVSNALGTVNPVREMVRSAHEAGIPVLVDGAQAVPHGPVDVQALDCDFYVFSGHKMFGPTGIGILYARERLLETMPPYQGGGDMIKSVSFSGTIYNDLPYKFEAGTPNIAGAVGLGESVAFLRSLDWTAVHAHEQSLLRKATAGLQRIDGVRLVGTAPDKQGVVSFVMDQVHPHDIGTILDREGVAIRTGHHCAQPVMERFGIPATARASFALYNDEMDIDRLLDGMTKVRSLMGV